MEMAPTYQNLIELFNRSLARVTVPDKTCVEVIRGDRHDTLTFAQLRAQAESFATWLSLESGLDRGDKVAIVSKNRADWDTAFWGEILAGMVPVLIDPERGPHGVMTHLEATDCRALILADDYGEEDSRRELADFCHAKSLRLLILTGKPLCDRTAPDPGTLARIAREVGENDTAVILCTSGTTGDPREVELTHANLIANLQGSIRKVDLTEADVLGHILPPHHSFGMTVGKLLALLAGATNIYTNRYREVADLIRDRNITIFIAIPALYTTLAKKLEDGINKQMKQSRLVRLLDRYAPWYVGRKLRRKLGWTKVRFFLSGAAPMPRWVLESLWRRGFKMYEGYGTTENSPVYGFNERIDRIGSVGQPISTLATKIVDENNQTLPARQKGEICLGGPCIARGYYRNPKATEAVIDVDEQGVRWLHTGDLGYLDEEGNLYITGRKKYLIILPGGKNVNPERIETALSEAQFVKDILVVPSRREESSGLMEESVRALVQPAWEAVESHTGRPRHELLAQPQFVKNLIWESIRDCQQRNKHLSSFEKIAAHNIEIHAEDFLKTSTGKVKRDHYINLEHLEAKHTRIVEYVASRTAKKPAHDPAEA
ncbi:MAG TPA: AMP-binding protein [Sedimentisphaerales bacterium]|jgi:long-chain acyl-CoA synthetase|nr:AMP-binding protein [Sedimentisphaerales bacterium]HNU28275.1 AMP-binding protein [Sedimentisphaerales bacterium]